MRQLDRTAKEFQEVLNLELLGFKMYNFDGFNLEYSLDLTDLVQVFSIGFRYGVGKKAVHYAGFSASLQINEIENVLLPLIIKYKNIQYSSDFPSATLHLSDNFSESEQMRENLLRFREIDIADNIVAINELASVVREQMKLHLNPLWAKYRDTKFINEEIIDKVSDEELTKYLIGMSALKKLIIMKLCNSPNYSSFRDGYQQRIEAAVLKDNKEEYRPNLNLVNELIIQLETR